MVDVFHCQVFVAAPFEGDEIHFTVDDVGEVADGLKAYDVTGLEDGIHRVARDVDGTVAHRDIGNYNPPQGVLRAVSQQCLQVGGGRDVIEGHATVVHRVGCFRCVKYFHFTLYQVIVTEF